MAATRRPENTAWLSDEERRSCGGASRASVVRRKCGGSRSPFAIRVLILASIQFGFLVGSYGIGIFLPQILDTGRLTDVQIGFVTSACYAVASIGMIIWAGVVDRGASKVVNLALACVLSACGFLGAIRSAISSGCPSSGWPWR